MTAFQEVEALLGRLSRSEKARIAQMVAEDLAESFPGVESSPGVCGGSARIVRTRIPIWTLETARRRGLSDAEILQAFPTFNAVDLASAWSYVRVHADEIELDIHSNKE
jgi:uncharacterized protein (DUF433 family)